MRQPRCSTTRAASNGEIARKRRYCKRSVRGNSIRHTQPPALQRGPCAGGPPTERLPSDASATWRQDSAIDRVQAWWHAGLAPAPSGASALLVAASWTTPLRGVRSEVRGLLAARCARTATTQRDSKTQLQCPRCKRVRTFVVADRAEAGTQCSKCAAAPTPTGRRNSKIVPPVRGWPLAVEYGGPAPGPAIESQNQRRSHEQSPSRRCW